MMSTSVVQDDHATENELREQYLEHVASRTSLRSLKSRLDQDQYYVQATVDWSLQFMLRDIRIETKYLNLKRRELEKRFNAGRVRERIFKTRIQAINSRQRDLGPRLYRLKRMELKNRPFTSQAKGTREDHAVRASLIKLLYHDFRNPAFSNEDLDDWNDIGATTWGMRYPGSLIIRWTGFRLDNEIPFLTPYCLVTSEVQPEIIDWVCGPGTGSRLMSADNCCMVPSVLCSHLESGNIVIAPLDPFHVEATTLCFRLLNDKVRDTVILSPDITLGALNGQEILFKSHIKPGLGFVYLSYVMAMFQNRLNRWLDTKDLYDTLRTKYPFSILKQFLRESFLIELERRSEVLTLDRGPSYSTQQQSQEGMVDPYSLDEILTSILLSNHINSHHDDSTSMPGYGEELEIVGKQDDFNLNKKRNLTLSSLIEVMDADEDCLSGGEET